ncbi:hypothetical protein [Amycolatopsis sp. AA4]|uniref:hypothetical protein n=1 Tax=Amycolatopsis sp. AA4 TaxID=1896961 RepID=UPI0013318FE9|nr:hypothetical protein [Amycolatopsis sp. AA4]
MGNVVGAAVGAVGGSVVGVFTSGAVDSLYQNVIGAAGTAIADGAKAVADAGKTIDGAAGTCRMPSSDALPRPEWPAPRAGRTVAAVVFVLLLGAAAIPVGFGFVAVGHPGGPRWATAFSAIMFLTAALGYVSRLRPRHRDANIAIVNREDGPAAEIRGSTLIFVLLLGIFRLPGGVLRHGGGRLRPIRPRHPRQAGAGRALRRSGAVLRQLPRARGGRAGPARRGRPVPTRHPPPRLDLLLLPALGRTRGLQSDVLSRHPPTCRSSRTRTLRGNAASTHAGESSTSFRRGR